MADDDRYELICRERFDRIERMLERIDRLLRGDDGDGVIVRLDRLEQGARARRKVIWVLAGVAASAIGALIRGLVR